MIYIDSSVVLAHVFSEDRIPPAELWTQPLASSRLCEYEVWNRVHGRGATEERVTSAQEALGRLAFLEMSREFLVRALEPFPIAVRTLDSIHLASVEHLRRGRPDIRLATYDRRMSEAARLMKIPTFVLP